MTSKLLLGIGVLAAIVGLTGAVTPGTAAFARPEPAAAKADEAGETVDQLIFANGRVVEGKLISETATQVVFEVRKPRMPAVKTTYEKSEIIEIKRGVAKAASATPATAATPAAPASTMSDESSDKEKKPKREERADAYRIYLVNFKGDFGTDVSETPIGRIFDDADRVFNDLKTVDTPTGKMQVVKDEHRKQNIVLIKIDARTDPRRGFDGIWRTEQLDQRIVKEIFEKGRRVVFWVKDAEGGAAFLPFLSSEIYFTKDGYLGGFGTLDNFDIGDKMVNEKQISLRLGHAEGFAVKGGYGQLGCAIIRAMARKQNWLAVRKSGAGYEFIEREPKEEDGPGWIVLTDDGEGPNKDEKALDGNDVLNLNQEWAQKLGVSKGTADTFDDLVYAMGIDRNYVLLEAKEHGVKGEQIMRDWSRSVEQAESEIRQRPQPGRLWEEYRDVRMPSDLVGMQKAIGRQINILMQIRDRMVRFAEVFDREGQGKAQIDVMIERHKNDLAKVTRALREGGQASPGGGGNSGGGGRPGGGLR
ncbi:MAG: hypothetical protein IBJ11_05725 [Phycisphaerales bacterium]|nr:hypothetical protein [Phycisphaerales bacterium]